VHDLPGLPPGLITVSANPLSVPEPLSEPSLSFDYDDIAVSLAEQGWCLVPGFVSPDLVSRLRAEGKRNWQSGAFRQAGIGRADTVKYDTSVRSDRILWLDPSSRRPAERDYLEEMEALRSALNRTLYLGLNDLESHYAVYPRGACYRRHLDQFQGASERILTSVLYLNHGWQPDHGGQLRLYTDLEDDGCYRDILPHGGTLVCFLSARFPHEVLPASRQRMSITGWFRARSANVLNR